VQWRKKQTAVSRPCIMTSCRMKRSVSFCGAWRQWSHGIFLKRST